jgi:hypothetical protein
MISPWRTGAAFGAVIGLFHLAWAALVALEAAQPVIDFILKIHFVELPLKIAPFNLELAVTLVSVTMALGYAGGVIFAWLWNWLHDGRGQGAARPAKAST